MAMTVFKLAATAAALTAITGVMQAPEQVGKVGGLISKAFDHAVSGGACPVSVGGTPGHEIYNIWADIGCAAGEKVRLLSNGFDSAWITAPAPGGAPAP